MYHDGYLDPHALRALVQMHRIQEETYTFLGNEFSVSDLYHWYDPTEASQAHLQTRYQEEMQLWEDYRSRVDTLLAAMCTLTGAVPPITTPQPNPDPQETTTPEEDLERITSQRQYAEEVDAVLESMREKFGADYSRHPLVQIYNQEGQRQRQREIELNILGRLLELFREHGGESAVPEVIPPQQMREE